MPGLPPTDLDFKARDFEQANPLPDAAPQVAAVDAPNDALAAAADDDSDGVSDDVSDVFFEFDPLVGTINPENSASLETIVENSQTIRGQRAAIKNSYGEVTLYFNEERGRDIGYFDPGDRAVVLTRYVMTDPQTSGAGAAVLAHELQHVANHREVTQKVAEAFEVATRSGGSGDTQFVRSFIDIKREDEARAEIAGWNAFMDLATTHAGLDPRDHARLADYSNRCMEDYFINLPDQTRGLKPSFAGLIGHDGRIAVTPKSIGVVGELFFDPPIAPHGPGAEVMDYRHRYAIEAIGELGGDEMRPVSLDFQALGLSPEIIRRKLGEDRVVDCSGAPGLGLRSEGPAVASSAILTPTGLPPADPRSNGLSSVPRSIPSDPDSSAAAAALENLGAVAGAVDFTFPGPNYDHLFWGQGPNLLDRPLGAATVTRVNDHIAASPTSFDRSIMPATAALSASETPQPEAGGVRQGKRSADADANELPDRAKRVRPETPSSVGVTVLGDDKVLAAAQSAVAAPMSAAAENPAVATTSAAPQSDPLQDKIRDGVRHLYESSRKPWDDDSERLSASALLMAEQRGFKPSDTIKISLNEATGNVAAGAYLLVERSGPGASPDPYANRASMQTLAALELSADQRHQQVAEVRQQQLHRPSQEQQVLTRNPDEANKAATMK